LLVPLQLRELLVPLRELLVPLRELLVRVRVRVLVLVLDQSSFRSFIAAWI